MRSRLIGTVILPVLGITLLFLVVPRITRFAHIFSTHSGPALTQEQVEAAFNATSPEQRQRQQFIPAIIHQIFHNWADPTNTTLPADWEVERQSCIKKNPDFKHELWTQDKSLEFLKAHYEWFVDTYNGYQFPVQRVDALRYFLMRHFGGIYIDLDNGCSRDLKPLLFYPAWVTDGGQGTLSNNILGARPGHPYWNLITESLISWGYHYPLPYLAVSYATGQWFETAIWEQYHSILPKDAPEENRIYHIMMDMRPGADRWVFFTAGRGGTWDQWDNRLFGYIGNVFIPWVCRNGVWIILGTVSVLGLHWYWRRRQFHSGYRKLARDDRVETRESV